MASVTAAVTIAATEGTDTAPRAEGMEIVEDGIHREVAYLIKDSKYENEKLYELGYDLGGLIPNTNMVNGSRPIIIRGFLPMCLSYSAMANTVKNKRLLEGSYKKKH